MGNSRGDQAYSLLEALHTSSQANLLAKRQVCTNIDAGMFRVQGDLLDQTTFQER